MDSPVSSLIMVTFAPGITPPLVSLTVPEIAPVSTCANMVIGATSPSVINAKIGDKFLEETGVNIEISILSLSQDAVEEFVYGAVGLEESVAGFHRSGQVGTAEPDHAEST